VSVYYYYYYYYYWRHCRLRWRSPNIVTADIYNEVVDTSPASLTSEISASFDTIIVDHDFKLRLERIVTPTEFLPTEFLFCSQCLRPSVSGHSLSDRLKSGSETSRPLLPGKRGHAVCFALLWCDQCLSLLSDSLANDFTKRDIIHRSCCYSIW